MHSINRTLFPLALGALFAAPIFAGDKQPVIAPVKTPASVPQASDAVSATATARESGRIKAPTAAESDGATSSGNDSASQGEANASAHSAVVTRDLWLQLDGNSDGKLSSSEVSGNSSLSGVFSGIDGNGDGFVTQAEYTTYAKAGRKQ